MADKDGRTLPASVYKLVQARQKGQLARSKEISPAMGLMGLALLLLGLGTTLVGFIGNVARHTFTNAVATGIREPIGTAMWDPFFGAIFFVILPLHLMLMVLPFLSVFFQGGFVISSDPLKIKFERLNPVKGFGKLMSLQSLFLLFKSILTAVILALLSWQTLKPALPLLPTLMMSPPADTFEMMGELFLTLFFRFALFMLLLSVIDYVFQRFKFARDMRMTKQESRDEHKNIEGNPQTKSRIRGLMMRKAYKRMMQQVPQATAVVTNPTHFAVALKYDKDTSDAPMVVAKGVDHMALRIRKTAEAHGVPVVEDRFLARALFQNTEVGSAIPPLLYRAVAELLAYLYRAGKIRGRLLN